MRRATRRKSAQDWEATEAAALLCVRALQVIRTSAYLGRPVDAPPQFTGDAVEWIRLVADACDGLANVAVRDNADEILRYRRSVWSPEQAAWANAVLAARDHK